MQFKPGDKIKIYGTHYLGIVTKELPQAPGKASWYEVRLIGYGFKVFPRHRLILVTEKGKLTEIKQARYDW